MSREEYMKQLSFLLQDIPESEKEEALAYYEDYFEEAGEGQEVSVIMTLGSPEKVAALIKEGLRGADEDAGEYTDAGYQDDRFSEFNKVPQPSDPYGYYQQQDQSQERERYTRDKGWGSGGKIVLLIIIGIMAIPVIIPLAASIFGLGVGVLATIFGLSIALAAITFAIFVAGVAFVGVGIAKLFVSPALGLLTLGSGMVMIALGLLLVLACVAVYGKFVPLAVRSITGLGGRLLRRGRRRA